MSQSAASKLKADSSITAISNNDSKSKLKNIFQMQTLLSKSFASISGGISNIKKKA